MARSVTFLTRPGCGICDDALARSRRIAQLLRVEVQVIDITDDPQLEDEYHLRIPVVLDRDRTVLGEGSLSTWDLLRALVTVRG